MLKRIKDLSLSQAPFVAFIVAASVGIHLAALTKPPEQRPTPKQTTKAVVLFSIGAAVGSCLGTGIRKKLEVWK